MRTSRALESGQLALGFLGGSITADNGGNWPDSVVTWFQSSYPGIALVIENGAVGATGSDSGCLRADHEIIARGCDLCFVEYAVNDETVPTDRRGCSREGLVRKLLAAGIEVVLVHAYSQLMYDSFIEGRAPPSIAEFETLADLYCVSSVWAGLHAFNEVRLGRLKWHQWLPDGLHPSHLGSHCYGEAVSSLLEQAIPSDALDHAPSPPCLPDPIYKPHWQNTSLLELTSVKVEGPWVMKRIHDYKHIEQVLETHAVGARLCVNFSGRGLVLIIEYGKIAAEFKYRIDGGEWMVSSRLRHDWMGERGCVTPFVVSDELPYRGHMFELEVIHGNSVEYSGTEFRLGGVFVLQ